ncbi:MAG: TIGR03960 family B12-binding radical SAM protein [Methylocystaceae bacterium]
MNIKDKLYQDILPRVKKPARYTGGEYNMMVKDWERARVKMALAFPDVYEVGMSHLGGRILYGIVNEQPDMLLERVYAPWPDMEEQMRSEGLPLYSLESFHPVSEFDVIGFSLMYELCYTNVLNMLDLAGLPLLSRQRDQNMPLVVAGGTCTVNSEPMADFIDAFMIGDGEEVLVELLQCVAEHRDEERESLLRRLAAIPGVYVPSLYEINYYTDGTVKQVQPLAVAAPTQVKRRVVADLDAAYFPTRQLVPYLDIVHDRGILEVMRGCQRSCRFCQAGMVYRPVRERSLATLLEQGKEIIENTGHDELSLASLSTADYTEVGNLIPALVERMGNQGVGVSLPSLRVDAFSVAMANEVQKVRKTTLTFAPEAGTQRLRDVINKNVREEDLLAAAESAFTAGWSSLKLYFMVGLPTETEEDWQGIIDLVFKVRAIGSRLSRRPVKITASIANFVPKPHTPFQWHPQISREEMRTVKEYFYQHGKRKGVSFDFHDANTSFLEGVFARGDRRLGPVLLEAYQQGAKFDGWREMFQIIWWEDAFKKVGVDPAFYIYRHREYDELLPWEVIDIGVDRDYLIGENKKAEAVALTPDCREGCEGCGICPSFEVDLDLKGEWRHATQDNV